MEQKLKKYKLWYKIFLVIGILGILDIVTQSIIAQTLGIEGFGGISFALLYVFNLLFGPDIASSVSVFLKLILDFSVVWLIVAWVIKSKTKKLKIS